MPRVFIFHIALTLSVAMVNENGRQYSLKCRKCHFVPHFGGFTDCFQKLDISTAKYQKDISIFLYLVIIYHPFKYRVGICLCSMLAGLLNLQISAQNDILSILAYIGGHFL